MADQAEPAVRMVGLGKKYRIGDPVGAGMLYDVLGEALRLPRRNRKRTSTTIWAVRDITLDVPRGHVLGVLGRNGSGKSTLMRILARVTSPTVGTAVIHGRVGALLQVGTGFHPYLTGRENIALSGAILGMGSAEIRSVRQDVIDFADLGAFLDTAVKHYSSGMYLRLAFSVAAHMSADILLIDEVLSVGDAAFQRKCRDRLRVLVAEGRTVLFVSHSMAAVKDLCDTAIVLSGGEVIFEGGTGDAVALYERDVERVRTS